MEQLYLGKNYKLYYKSVALQYLNNQDLQAFKPLFTSTSVNNF